MSNDVTLPFLIIHGALVWKIALVALTGVLLLAGRWFRRSWVHELAYREMAALGATAGLRVGDVVLRGTLRGGSASTTYWCNTKFDHARDEVWLDCAGVRVFVRGEIHVLHGSKLERAGGAARVASVRDGDIVVVEGTVALEASDAETSYRASAGSWVVYGRPPVPSLSRTLVDDRSRDVIQLRAERFVTRPWSLNPAALLAAMVVCALAVYGGMRWLGERMLSEARGQAITELGELDAHAIAAALPKSREPALADLRQRFTNEQLTPPQFALRRAIDRFDGCEAEARLLLRATRHDEALALARGCGLRSIEREVMEIQGRYRDAAIALDESSGGAIFTAIAAEHWWAAADLADKRAAEVPRTYPGFEPDPVGDRRRAASYRCIAQLLRSWAGSTAAPGRLRALSTESGVCAIAAGELTARGSRTSETRAVWPGDQTRGEAWLARIRGLADGDPWLEDEPMHVVLHTKAFGSRLLLWFAPWLAREATSEGDRKLASAWQTIRNDFLGASSGAGTNHDGYLDEHCSVMLDAALEAADSEPLVTVLTECRWNDGVEGKLLTVLPRIRDRAAIVELLKIRPIQMGDHPYERLRAAALRRDVMRAAGDPVEAERWQQIVLAQAAVLADRQRLMALAMWDAVN